MTKYEWPGLTADGFRRARGVVTVYGSAGTKRIRTQIAFTHRNMRQVKAQLRSRAIQEYLGPKVWGRTVTCARIEDNIAIYGTGMDMWV